MSEVAVGKVMRMRSAATLPANVGTFHVPLVQSLTLISRVASDGIERMVTVPIRRNWSEVVPTRSSRS